MVSVLNNVIPLWDPKECSHLKETKFKGIMISNKIAASIYREYLMQYKIILSLIASIWLNKYA